MNKIRTQTYEARGRRSMRNRIGKRSRRGEDQEEEEWGRRRRRTLRNLPRNANPAMRTRDWYSFTFFKSFIQSLACQSLESNTLPSCLPFLIVFCRISIRLQKASLYICCLIFIRCQYPIIPLLIIWVFLVTPSPHSSFLLSVYVSNDNTICWP